nr:hypothetical protein [Eggerthella lenta]
MQYVALSALRADERRALAPPLGAGEGAVALLEVPGLRQGCALSRMLLPCRSLHLQALRHEALLGRLRRVRLCIALGLKNALLSFTSLDTVVGDTPSFRAISRKGELSLSMSSISHLSSKSRRAPFFSGMASSFLKPEKGI